MGFARRALPAGETNVREPALSPNIGQRYKHRLGMGQHVKAIFSVVVPHEAGTRSAFYEIVFNGAYHVQGYGPIGRCVEPHRWEAIRAYLVGQAWEAFSQAP
jgi:hypothetical protein